MVNHLSGNKSALENVLFFLSFIAYPSICYCQALSRRNRFNETFAQDFRNLKNSVENLVIKLVCGTRIIPLYEFSVLTMREIWHTPVRDRILSTEK